MILKDSQLRSEWPIVLTPAEREQFLKEKVARVQAWYQHLQNHEKQKHPDLKRS